MSTKHEPGMAFDMQKLNKVFAFLSILFLLTTIWVFLDDYIRPWKKVQLDAMQIKRTKLTKDMEEAEKKINQTKLNSLEEKLGRDRETVAGRNEEINRIGERRSALSKLIASETILNGQLNAFVSETTFNYESALAHHDGKKAAKLFSKMRNLKSRFSESKNRLKEHKAEDKTLKNQTLTLKAEVLSTEKEIKSLTMNRALLKKAKARTDISPVFVLRNLPFIDFMDPTLKIQQIVLKNITDDRFFRQVEKVDRCITCHTFIDQPGYEDQENPHKTHPNLALILGNKSPHPIKEIGCTICHGGEGHRVLNFNSAAHTPKNVEQKAAWVEKYNWHEPHKVPQPMLKTQQTEASCIKCHKDWEFIPGATVLNEGRQKIEEFGCYACHKLEGWEHKRKPGPSLKKIAGKIDKEFFKNWVWDPKAFNAHAKMPSFFNQSNNSKPEHMVKNVTEVNAIAEFIWKKSETYHPFARHTGGNSGRGKELIKEVGCLACHGVEGLEEDSKKIGAYAGPYLTGIGSKLKGDFLVSWLKKPSHYQEDSIMPSFRLSDREANDIASYLLSLKNEKFEQLKFEKLNEPVMNEVLLSYFGAFDTKEGAQRKLDGMSYEERVHELGYRSVGKYGCYSCHNIDGFEGRGPIGPELSAIGSKPITQFGYGIQHDVGHSRDAWISAHLLNPRRWDIGIDKPFKDLTRMPNFDMTKDESEKITTALLGYTTDPIPTDGKKNLNANESLAADGMKVIHKYNCVGCHQIDGYRGDILAKYEDDLNEGPPMLNGQGHRVHADWFYNFLDNVYKIRPWLTVRMPSFNLSNDEKNAIVTMFQAKSDQVTFEDIHKRQVEWLPGEKNAASKLFKALDCASCHTQGFNNDEASAPNLHYAKGRLRPSWIGKWLSNPSAVLENTVMPNFWEDGESLEPGILGGDPKRQIQALTKYLMDIGYDKYHKPIRR